MKKLIIPVLCISMLCIVNINTTPTNQTKVSDSAIDILDEIKNEIEQLSYDDALTFLKKLEVLLKELRDIEFPDIKTCPLIGCRSYTNIYNDPILKPQRGRMDAISNRFQKKKLPGKKYSSQRNQVTFKKITSPPISAALADVLEEIMSEIKKLNTNEIEQLINELVPLIKDIRTQRSLEKIVSNVKERGIIPEVVIAEPVEKIMDPLREPRRSRSKYCFGETDAPANEQKHIDTWLKNNGYNKWGDKAKKGRKIMYTGGSASFDERLGCYHSQYSILKRKFRDRPWNK